MMMRCLKVPSIRHDDTVDKHTLLIITSPNVIVLASIGSDPADMNRFPYFVQFSKTSRQVPAMHHIEILFRHEQTKNLHISMFELKYQSL